MEMKENNKIFSKKILLITNILSLVLIVILVLIIFTSSSKNGIKKISRDNDINYVFTSPILDCEDVNQSEESVISYKSLSGIVENLKNKYKLSHVSLYFRDLNNGPWVGINENEVFSPASLLKVPIMMAFLNEAENNPLILDKKVQILQSDVDKTNYQNIKFENLLILGKEYSLKEVAEYMIQKSDNTAVPILLRNTNLNEINNVFKSVGVPFQDTTSEINIKVKDYAGFFRVLFNSSYLNRQMSETALQILSKSEYVNGLVAGVPGNIKIAHKFGERSINKTDLQLHDCGIVYYPGKPYLLCIMTHGDNFANQEKVIQELSRYIYNQVDKKNDY